MTFKLLVFTALFLSGCVSAPKKKTLVEEISALKNRTLKSYYVSSRTNAKEFFGKKTQFLKLLFEQFSDPITGEPRWSEQCLAENIIGPVEEQETHIVMVSTLYTDRFGSLGFCSDSIYAGKAINLFLYCEGSNEVLEFKYLAGPALNIEDFILCP